jgi:2-polyprenyl-3-methyl-5-hydroxy-6-metoxy-1,4-benzoquinol methylase
MKKRCIVCDHSENSVVFQENGIDVLRCTNCGHVFSSFHAMQDYDGYFKAYSVVSADQFWWNEAHKEMYEDFCQRFIAGQEGQLLDVGCGLGYFVKRVSAFSSWRAFGYEISRQAVDFARARLGLPNVFCGRVEDSKLAKKSFDIITLWDVIEHIPNPDPLLSYLSSLLKEDGVLFIHTPNVRVQLPKAKLRKLLRGMRAGIHYLEAKDHINIYSEKTIASILNRNGFSHIRFIHLKPIQSLAGSRNQLLRFLKNFWFYSSCALFHMTFGRINLDNLFVLARK